ncbi:MULTISPECIES: SDR family oxidoreductase [Glaesserella]|uniref:Short-chain dehydrogenase n=1 Tax=Glaesserella australis TaxID=2094024 RepID=A0A328BVC6_9PAST|nr:MULTISPECIES: SDR family oxidoreductase [Glaesserella]AUI66012.1 short-chain dehydrogenase [Glaesserella sp. 15-184]RAL18268.1 short-chain dehydrogenase [Glaesserella australis]
MTQTALITGASNGIGLEFAKIHAKQGGDLVLVARSADKLAELADELRQTYNVKVTTIAQDLAQPQAAQAIFNETEKLGIQVDILINNAGVGGHGRFFERDLVKESQMIQLNIASLTELTHFYLQGMVARKQGKILNVSSTASFLPGPLQAVYYASKAYVTSFSQAIAEEVREFGVTVTALCPGAVATGFVAAGDLQGVDAWKNAKTPEEVAAYGYKAMQQDELVAFNEAKLKFASDWVLPFLPRKTVLKISRMAMEKKK